MSWRVAKGLLKLRAQVDEMFPGRSKDSDGTIGDVAHASRNSDHNPWVQDHGEGVVTAIDITNDPKTIASETLAQALIAAKDRRIKYIISNRKIYSGFDQEHSAWVGRAYTGSNPHDHHVHISIKSDKGHYDDESEWDLSKIGAAPPVPESGPTVALPLTLRRGSHGIEVENLQRLLNMESKEVDGVFGPKTQAAVENYQRSHGLYDDGVVGPQTWKKLKGLT